MFLIPSFIPSCVYYDPTVRKLSGGYCGRITAATAASRPTEVKGNR